MPRKCNNCEGTWVSQSRKCIHCGSEDIIWEFAKDKNSLDLEEEK